MKLQFLGPIEAWSGGVRVALGPPQQRCLLAALATDVNRVVPVDRLADIVWSGEPPLSARNALQIGVSRLRRLFDQYAAGGGPRLVTQAPGYLLAADPDDIDMHRFGRLVASARGTTDDGERAALLRTALLLWRGEAMGDLESGARERMAAGLDEARWLAVEDRVDAELRLGRHGAELVDELQELVRLQPLRERLAGQYLTALHRGGRRAEAVAYYRRLTVRLAEELGVQPGAELRRVHATIVRTDPAPAPARSGAAPAQLPPPVHGFTGRAVELSTMDEIYRAAQADGEPGVAALVGTAGVGKTALALQWAHRHAASFPDGQLYVDLQGYGGARRLEPAQALERLLRLLGVDGGGIPAAVEERTALFRSRVNGRAMLLVLDNARSSAELRPLLPASAGVFSLITSRNRLAGLAARDGARPVAVHRLSTGDAHRLLEGVAGAAVRGRPRAADRLAELCDNLPLALRIAAARLAAGESTVDALIAELSDARSRLDALSVEDGDSAVRSVMTTSYQAVPAEAARLLRLLGAAPVEDVDAEGAAALLGAPPEQGRRLLALLADEHLLERRAAGRYGMHDLVKLLATGLAEREETPAARREAVRRLFAWYAHTAHAAETVLNPQLVRLGPPAATRPAHPRAFEAAEPAFGWLDAERANLFAAVRHAAATALYDEAWQLANALFTYLRRRYYLADYIEFYELGEAAATAAGNTEARAVLAGGLGIAYSFARRVDDALAAYGRAEELFGTLGDLEQQARVRGNQGSIRMEAGDHDRAAADLLHAIDLARRAGSPTVEGAYLCTLGLLQIWRGTPAAAEPYLAAALRVSSTLDRPYWGPNVHENYGDMHLGLGNHDAAAAHYTDALTAARAIGERVVEARVLASLAEALVHGGHPGSGRERMNEALALAHTISGPLANDIEQRLAKLDA